MLLENVKVCSDCKESKDLIEYYTQKKKDKYGAKYIYYQPRCKKCSIKKSQNWQKEHPERVKEISIKDKKTKTDYHKSLKKKYYEENKEKVKMYKKDWDRKNTEKHVVYNSNRRAYKNNLINTLTDKDVKRLEVTFSKKCFLSGKDDTHLEHFIPLSWGHGGTYVGNVYFLWKNLNFSKSNKNPFEWIKEKEVANKIDIDKWYKLIKILAEQNNLTVEEFREFVYWCDKNRRSPESITNENSIDLWKNNNISIAM